MVAFSASPFASGGFHATHQPMEVRTHAKSRPARPMELTAQPAMGQSTFNQPKAATHLPCDMCLAVFSLTIVTFAMVGLALNFQAMNASAASAQAVAATASLSVPPNVTLVAIAWSATVGLGFAIAAVVASIRDCAKHAIGPNLAILATVASLALLLWVVVATGI